VVWAKAPPFGQIGCRVLRMFRFVGLILRVILAMKVVLIVM
jgi:hypothetical protein